MPNRRSGAVGRLLVLPWPVLCLWTVVALAVFALGIGDAEVLDWVPHGSSRFTAQSVPSSALERALIGLVRATDAVWFFLAGVNAYTWLAHAEGLAVARRWAAIIILPATVLTWLSGTGGWPLGPIAYTNVLGPRLGGVVPVTIPFLWFVVIIGSRCAVLALLPNANRWLLSLGVAGLALLTDFNMEAVAWKIRAYWIWYPLDLSPAAGPPIQNYVTWAAAAFGLHFALGENTLRVTTAHRAWQPIAILGTMNLLFLASRAAAWR